MIVLKFGGTSVGSAENMKKVASVIAPVAGPKIVVLSAMSGTTNTLVSIASQIKAGEADSARREAEQLALKYNRDLIPLFKSESYLKKLSTLLDFYFGALRAYTEKAYSKDLENKILALGELLSTNIFQLYLSQEGENSILISALDFMRIDERGEPDKDFIKTELHQILRNHLEIQTFVTQGFICRNTLGKIDNLERGGSDYTASLIGAAISADQIQIYTDIDGMHNNDPRYVDKTYSLEEITFDEAAELAYFGAKILHPQSILPAKENNIPVLVKNTFKPEARGTMICNCDRPENNIRAVAAKDGITAIKIKSYRMLMAYGFLKKIFEIFDRNRTAIDMITTSEVAVSLTIDNDGNLDEIISELKEYGSVEVDSGLSIICIAGDISENNKGITASIFNCLQDIPIRMISYGGSSYNMSFVVKTRYKNEVLNLLNEGLFTFTDQYSEGILIGNVL